MNRTALLVTGSLILSLIAAALGYRAGSTPPGEAVPTLVKNTPRFTQSINTNTPAPEEPPPDSHSLDALLVRYSRMTPEQLEQEITRNYTTKGVDLRSGGNRRFKLLLTPT